MNKSIKNRFIIFFHEKEGTTAIVNMLNTFHNVSLLRSTKNDYEPFDKHQTGKTHTLKVLNLLREVYLTDQNKFEKLNRQYFQFTGQHLTEFDENDLVGCKMRMRVTMIRRQSGRQRPGSKTNQLTRLKQYIKKQIYLRKLSHFLKENHITVFLAIRQDHLRKGLSKYHGDGKGNTGHLQFKVQTGSVKIEDLPKIHVDLDRLEACIEDSKYEMRFQKVLYQFLDKKSIPVFPMPYETFLEDKTKFFSDFFEQVGMQVDKQEISKVIELGTKLKKVHSKNISDFVLNDSEVLEAFGNEFEAWNDGQFI